MIVGMGGAIDINHLAVWQAIDRYQIEKPIETFEKVIRLAGNMISYVHQEHEKEREGKNSHGR